MRNFINIINESYKEVEEASLDEQQVDEKLAFDGHDVALDNAFMKLCNALNVHESAYQSMMYRLGRDGVYSRNLDPRDSVNKFTPEQWAKLNQEIAPYLSVAYDAPTLTITALK
jgi:hypothetical protein